MVTITIECEFFTHKQKHQIDKKIPRKDKNFSTRLTYAIKKMKKHPIVWLILKISRRKVRLVNYKVKGKPKFKFTKI